MTRNEAKQIHDAETVEELEAKIKGKVDIGMCLGKLCIYVDSNGFYHYSERKAFTFGAK